MYKAGDFTNGKMNEIFKQCFSLGESTRYDSGVRIKHKQLGGFSIISDGGLIAPTLIMLGDVQGFYDYVKVIMSNHNNGLHGEDPSKFKTSAGYLSVLSADCILKVSNDFFNDSNESIDKFDFQSLFCLLNWLISEKDCTYSTNK